MTVGVITTGPATSVGEAVAVNVGEATAELVEASAPTLDNADNAVGWGCECPAAAELCEPSTPNRASDGEMINIAPTTQNRTNIPLPTRRGWAAGLMVGSGFSSSCLRGNPR